MGGAKINFLIARANRSEMITVMKTMSTQCFFTTFVLLVLPGLALVNGVELLESWRCYVEDLLKRLV